MKGCYFLGNGTFEVRTMTEHPLGDEEVLIENRAAGVCGTDVHIRQGEKGSADVTPPVILGHEYSGIVRAVGSKVTTVRPGDCVTVDPNIYCGKCRPCRNGQKQYCENLFAIGVNRDGGFAECSYVPQSQVFPMNPSIGFEAMAMTEPLACCIHGIEQVRLQSGDTVLVIGGGAIGLLMVQLALLRGASRVILSEPIAHRRNIGVELGACGAIDPNAGDLPAQLRQMTGRADADVIIECVGNTCATAQAVALAARGARILLFSVPKPDATYALPLMDVFQKELHLMGSFINPNSHQQAVDLLSAGRIRTDILISHRFGLDEVDKAIAMQMSSESIKVLVLPQQL